LANLILFLIPWLAIVVGSLALILVGSGMPHGFVPYVAIMAMEMLVSTCFIIAVALISESLGLVTGAILVGNLAIIGFGYYVGHIKSIAAGLLGNKIHWTTAASTVLLAEFLTIAFLLGFTFFVQSRKRGFL